MWNRFGGISTGHPATLDKAAGQRVQGRIHDDLNRQ
jgi:hypothetical protein